MRDGAGEVLNVRRAAPQRATTRRVTGDGRRAAGDGPETLAGDRRRVAAAGDGPPGATEVGARGVQSDTGTRCGSDTFGGAGRHPPCLSALCTLGHHHSCHRHHQHHHHRHHHLLIIAILIISKTKKSPMLVTKCTKACLTIKFENGNCPGHHHHRHYHFLQHRLPNAKYFLTITLENECLGSSCVLLHRLQAES